MISRLNKVKIQAFYLKNLETSIIAPKKPKAVFDDHLTLPQEVFKELEKLPHNDIDEKAETYIEDVCIGICRCASIILLHEQFKKTLEMIAGKYGQVWPIIYANMILEAQVLMNKKVLYEANKVYQTPETSTQALLAEKNQVSQGATQLLQFINTVEGQANGSEQFGRAKVEFFLDKALLLRRLIAEVYSLLDVPADVKIKHVEKGVSAVKSAEKAITKVMEKDPKFDAKIDENGRNALISGLYSMSSQMILGDDDDDEAA